MKMVAHLSRSPVISTSISRLRGSCVWWKCPISKRKNHEIVHALEQRATSKVPNRVFRPRKSHEWGPPASQPSASMHASRAETWFMTPETVQKAKQNAAAADFLRMTNVRARSVTRDDAVGCAHLHSPLFVCRCSSRVARVSLNFLWERNYSARTLYDAACQDCARLTNYDVWHAGKMLLQCGNNTLVHPQWRTDNLISHFLTWLQFLISSEKRKLKTVEILISFMIYCGRWKSNHNWITGSKRWPLYFSKFNVAASEMVTVNELKDPLIELEL
jgi:hypothetical protein